MDRYELVTETGPTIINSVRISAPGDIYHSNNTAVCKVTVRNKGKPSGTPANLIIGSIAFECLSMSHILDSEGTKIQKAIEANVSIEDLIKIDGAVCSVIEDSIKLDTLAQRELETL